MGKKFIVSHPDCGFCKVVKEHLKEKIESGEIGEIDVTTEEGRKLAVEKYGLRAVPECLEEDGEGGYKKCDLKELIEENK